MKDNSFEVREWSPLSLAISDGLRRPRGGTKAARKVQMKNWDMVESKWNQLGDQVKARWGRLSAADIEKIGGKRSLLVAKLQESYNIFQLEAETQVTTWTNKLAKAAAPAAASEADPQAPVIHGVTPADPSVAPAAGEDKTTVAPALEFPPATDERPDVTGN